MKYQLVILLTLFVALIAVVLYFGFQQRSATVDSDTLVQEESIETTDPSLQRAYSDAHAHVLPKTGRVSDYKEALAAIETEMDERNIDFVLVMPFPFSSSQRGFYEMDEFADLFAPYKNKIGFLAGGGSLNMLIQEHAEEDRVSFDVLNEFERKARSLMDLGASGFGEMTALHLSLGEDHVFELAAPDHPLFFLLSDLADEYDVPIDLHMEAVVEEMETPEDLRLSSSHNPLVLEENISAFERLLEYNKDTKIIWSHAGWDHLGTRTPELIRRLFEAHDNLSMSLKIGEDSNESTRPLESTGVLKSKWESLLIDYADRFFIGSDQFYTSSGNNSETPNRNESIVKLIEQLPEKSATQILQVTARQLFDLKY